MCSRAVEVEFCKEKDIMGARILKGRLCNAETLLSPSNRVPFLQAGGDFE